jgi:hypothetical protein
MAMAVEAAKMVEGFMRSPIFPQVGFFPCHGTSFVCIKEDFNAFIAMVRVLIDGTHPAASDQQIKAEVQEGEVLAIFSGHKRSSRGGEDL